MPIEYYINDQLGRRLVSREEFEAHQIENPNEVEILDDELENSINEIRNDLIEFNYNLLNDSHSIYGYGYGHGAIDYQIDSSVFTEPSFFIGHNPLREDVTVSVDEALHQLRELEKKRRHEVFGKIWAHNTSRMVQIVPHLNLGLPVGKPIDLMEHTDIGFLKKNAKDIFDWFDKRVNEINLFYQKLDGPPVVGANKIKDIVLNGKEEKDLTEIQSLIELE